VGAKWLVQPGFTTKRHQQPLNSSTSGVLQTGSATSRWGIHPFGTLVGLILGVTFDHCPSSFTLALTACLGVFLVPTLLVRDKVAGTMEICYRDLQLDLGRVPQAYIADRSTPDSMN
jgi:hypothetical protein